MDQAQRKYSLERVTRAYEQKKSRLREGCSDAPKNPTDKELLNAIRDGEIDLKRGRDITMDSTLREAFVFHPFVPTLVLNTAKYQEQLSPVTKQFHETCDAIMLGTEEDALTKIMEFCKEG